MEIREYRQGDCAEMIKLFYDTVHAINALDYTKEQLDAWTAGIAAREAESIWNGRFSRQYSLVAVIEGKIVGFADMDVGGYLDMLYVHKDYQGRHVASALCDRLESAVSSPVFTTHASITAKGFFEKRGYRVIKQQQVERAGVWLTNYVMEKRMKEVKT